MRLYADNRYTEIRRYLIKHDITTLDLLAQFDFNKLKILPNVSETDIVFAKEVFHHAWNDHIIETAPLENYQITSLPDEDENFDYSKFVNSIEIDILPLSKRAKNCLLRSNINSLEKLYSLNEEELMSIRNLGVKTCREILQYVQSNPLSEIQKDILYKIENINNENKNLPLVLLSNIGCNQERINSYVHNGLSTVGDLLDSNVTPQEYTFLHPVINELSFTAVDLFKRCFNSLKDIELIIVEKKSYGATLREIGNELGITHERVRQILLKSCQYLLNYAELVVGILLSDGSISFTLSDVQSVLHDEFLAHLCMYVLHNSTYVTYFKYSDKFIKADIYTADVETRLSEYVEKTIGAGINIKDNLELLESELSKYSLHFLSIDDITNYLVFNNYHFYGDYVNKGKKHIETMCEK